MIVQDIWAFPCMIADHRVQNEVVEVGVTVYRVYRIIRE
jgi:hypothetical protein